MIVVRVNFTSAGYATGAAEGVFRSRKQDAHRREGQSGLLSTTDATFLLFS